MHRTWFVTVAAITLMACGGGAAETGAGAGAGQGTGGGETATEVPSPPAPWAEMSADDRRHWMADEVLPRMAPLFEAHDAGRFGDFGCESCHGDDMVARNFEMPNPGILALHPTGSDEQHQMVRDHPQMVRFMFNRVVPTMQQLLGAPDFDEATGEGFSCYHCHLRAGG